jgi:hypothetical protein
MALLKKGVPMNHVLCVGLFALLALAGCTGTDTQPSSPAESTRQETSSSRASPAVEQAYQEVVSACLSFARHGEPATDPQRWNRMIKAVKPVLSKIDDPVLLRDLIIRICSQAPQCTDRDPLPSCQACEAIRDSFEPCLYRLVDLGTDDAARELVYLMTVEDCHWDGASSMALHGAITRMGTKALPYLEPMEAKNSMAKRDADFIRRGEVVVP